MSDMIIPVKIKLLTQTARMPEKMSDASAGYDIYSDNDVDINLRPMQRVLIPSGFMVSLPKGYEAQIRPRSGLAINNGITVLNSPGTIDSDYRGEVKIILINLSDNYFTIKPAMRIAQMIISKHENVYFELVEEIDETQRGSGGFGHTYA